MFTFDEAREIAAAHYDEPFARDGWEDDGAFLVTPQRVVDDERQGLVEIGAAWIAVSLAISIAVERTSADGTMRFATPRRWMKRRGPPSRRPTSASGGRSSPRVITN